MKSDKPSLRKYKCKNPDNNPRCKGEVSYNTYRHGSGLCRSCSCCKDGRTLKQYYCAKCGKKISITSTLYGSGLCISCSKIEQFKDPKNRQKLSRKMTGKKHTAESRKIISLVTKGKKNGMYGRKHTKEAQKKISLAQGGTGIPYENATYPEEFNRALRAKIRKRDNFTCQMSEMTEKEHLKKCGRVLDVHHIDYNKQNCKEDNLITLTSKWNLKVNQNRKYWTKYFKEIIKRKYQKELNGHDRKRLILDKTRN